MCGIAAIWAYNADAPSVSRDELLKIRDAMKTRGPDGEGLYLSPDGRLGLAHRRLSIIDLSPAGAQPMSNASGTVQIIFNGEIYNYRELRRDLEKEGVRFTSNSDTEVLLHLYEHKGANFVDDLRGMYAIAIWDTKIRGVLLARDPLGIKPLYYADDGKTLRVASQVKALLAGGAVSRTQDSAGVVGFHLLGSVPEPFTLYKSIQAMPAGKLVWVREKSGVGKFDSFYSLPFISAPHTPDVPTLRHNLLDSIRHHREADVPVGVFLSAGLDSGTLTALSAELAPEGLHTVTLGFEELKGTANDEVPLAEKVARFYGTQHQTVMVTRDDFRRELPRLLAAMDQPSIDGVNTYFVSRAAAQTGLKVALSGIGSDELFGTYPSFRQIPRLVHALRPLRQFPGIGSRFQQVSSRWIGRFTSPKYAGLLEYGTTYEGAYLLRRGLFMPWELPGMLDPDLVRDGWQRLDLMQRLHDIQHNYRDAHWRVSAMEISMYMRNQLLRDADWAGMAHSLEIRVPFVDKEFIAAFDRLWETQHHIPKSALADTPTRPLPPEIRNRPKTGFSIPVREWAAAELGSPIDSHGLRSWARFLYNQI